MIDPKLKKWLKVLEPVQPPRAVAENLFQAISRLPKPQQRPMRTFSLWDWSLAGPAFALSLLIACVVGYLWGYHQAGSPLDEFMRHGGGSL